MIEKFTTLIKHEFTNLLKLLGITALLIVLPNESFGYGDVFNLFEIWMMVVLITWISFIGYILNKLFRRSGPLLTGLVGGLVASTIVTLNLSKLANNKNTNILASGIFISWGTMTLRVLLLMFVINVSLFKIMIYPMIASTVIFYIASIVYYLRSGKLNIISKNENSFDIITAIKFTLLLVVILFLSKFLQSNFDDIGIYALALFSGLSDVDAINLGLSKMHLNGELTTFVAILGILLAVNMNNFVKTIISLIVGNKILFQKILFVFTLSMIANLAIWYFLHI